MLRFISLLLIGCVGILAGCGRINGTASAPTSAPTASPQAPSPATPIPDATGTAVPPSPVATRPSAPASLNQPFTMNVGQKITIDQDLTVTFEGVTEDSRCPKSVLCAWSGAATSKVTLQRSGHDPATVTLSHPRLTNAPDQANYLDLTIQVLDVSPYPEAPEKKIPPDAYMITLMIAPSNTQQSP